MTERAEGYYWVRVLEYPPEVALWDADDGVWWCADDTGGYVPDAVAVLSPRLAPPVPAAPIPRVAVCWGVPPCAGEADTAGVLFGGVG